MNKNNFFVTVSPDTKEARRELSKFIFDLMVVDLMLPHEMGVDFLTKIRKDGNRTPAIMLTAMGDIKNKTKCFENGCDDYLVKPFEPKELILRINNILNKNENIKNNICEFGDYIFDFDKQILLKNNDIIYLTDIYISHHIVSLNTQLIDKNSLSPPHSPSSLSLNIFECPYRVVYLSSIVR